MTWAGVQETLCQSLVHHDPILGQENQVEATLWCYTCMLINNGLNVRQPMAHPKTGTKQLFLVSSYRPSQYERRH